MYHLDLETLARLVDESPDAAEAGHLDVCKACRAALEELRADSLALRALPDPQVPASAWLALEQRLGREGLVRRTAASRMHLVRIAAILLIFALGSLAGALLVQRQTPRMATSARQLAVPARSVADQTAAHSVTRSIPSVASVVRATPPTTRPATTAEEALARLHEAEHAYLAALGRFAEFSPDRVANADRVARLAALESIVATTRAALGQAPADPVINGYHITAVAQRDATLRQLEKSEQTWY